MKISNRIKTGSPTESFCECVPQKDLQCSCGEDQDVNWAWDNKHLSRQTVLSNCDKDVRFHPGYSSGTAAVRGNVICLPGYHYFWEIKMLTSLYGTDVMVGVGTEKAEIRVWAYRFCSVLGQDEHSWGYSYRGCRQHKGQFHSYGPRFGQGSIIGVHLDMCAGTIEFFHNRQPLGVAFQNVGAVGALYPMVSSTAARSAMRIINAVSYPPNLQLDCLLTIGKSRKLIDELYTIPGLRKALSEFWWVMTYSADEMDTFKNKLEIRKRKADPNWNDEPVNIQTNLSSHNIVTLMQSDNVRMAIYFDIIGNNVEN
ncbi:SPRY domain-containing SOCS box protein 3 isoform X2 [Chrysoperla carnea]|uniref:SPRY domain-containing SOCS box protein 3 isoform X2 n=1 Tax=Chrysoperla carnea TaxID=189513 RepID=UPI001D066753|nr:SPRY domain-containing SOCS box protein 3 isoform X2 [Chrysoperla carnea]